MRSINLDQLRTLMEVVELGSFSAAARRLNLTQPAVSLQIRELENRFAISLVKRVGKRAYATSAGGELIDHARGILDQTNRATAAMRRHKDGRLGRVHIGCGTAALTYLVLPILQQLRVDHPELDLAVTTGNTSEITERMLKNTIDIAVTGLPIDERMFEATFLRDMAMVAILPADDPEIPDTVTPADVARRTLIVTQPRSNYAQLAREWLRTAGLELQPAMAIDNIEVIKRVVAAGLGMSLIPKVAIQNGPEVEGIVVRPLDPPAALSVALVRRRNAPEDLAVSIVCEAISSLAETTH